MNKLDLFLSKMSLNEYSHSTSALGSVELYRFNRQVFQAMNGNRWFIQFSMV